MLPLPTQRSLVPPRPKQTHSCERSAGILATRAMHALHSLPLNSALQ